MNNFAIDWEKGTIIFTAHKAEDVAGNIISFPKNIEINKVLEMIPMTTNFALSYEKVYWDYSFDELRDIIKE